MFDSTLLDLLYHSNEESKEEEKKSLQERIALLESSSVFRSLPRRKLEQLALCMEENIVPPNTCIFYQQDLADYVYFIKEGTVRIDWVQMNKARPFWDEDELQERQESLQAQYDKKEFDKALKLAKRGSAPKMKSGSEPQKQTHIEHTELQPMDHYIDIKDHSGLNYFKIQVPPQHANAQTAFRIQVKAEGSAEMFVSTENSCPGPNNYTWRSASSAGNCIILIGYDESQQQLLEQTLEQEQTMQMNVDVPLELPEMNFQPGSLAVPDAKPRSHSLHVSPHLSIRHLLPPSENQSPRAATSGRSRSVRLLAPRASPMAGRRNLRSPIANLGRGGGRVRARGGASPATKFKRLFEFINRTSDAYDTKEHPLERANLMTSGSVSPGSGGRQRTESQEQADVHSPSPRKRKVSSGAGEHEEKAQNVLHPAWYYISVKSPLGLTFEIRTDLINNPGVRAVGGRKKVHQLGLLGPGSSLGEGSVFKDVPREVTAVTQDKEVTLFSLDKDSLLYHVRGDARRPLIELINRQKALRAETLNQLIAVSGQTSSSISKWKKGTSQHSVVGSQGIDWIHNGSRWLPGLDPLHARMKQIPLTHREMLRQSMQANKPGTSHTHRPSSHTTKQADPPPPQIIVGAVSGDVVSDPLEVQESTNYPVIMVDDQQRKQRNLFQFHLSGVRTLGMPTDASKILKPSSTTHSVPENTPFVPPPAPSKASSDDYRIGKFVLYPTEEDDPGDNMLMSEEKRQRLEARREAKLRKTRAIKRAEKLWEESYENNRQLLGKTLAPPPPKGEVDSMSTSDNAQTKVAQLLRMVDIVHDESQQLARLGSEDNGDITMEQQQHYVTEMFRHALGQRAVNNFAGKVQYRSTSIHNSGVSGEQQQQTIVGSYDITSATSTRYSSSRLPSLHPWGTRPSVSSGLGDFVQRAGEVTQMNADQALNQLSGLSLKGSRAINPRLQNTASMTYTSKGAIPNYSNVLGVAPSERHVGAFNNRVFETQRFQFPASHVNNGQMLRGEYYLDATSVGEAVREQDDTFDEAAKLAQLDNLLKERKIDMSLHTPFRSNLHSARAHIEASRQSRRPSAE